MGENQKKKKEKKIICGLSLQFTLLNDCNQTMKAHQILLMQMNL